MFEAYKIFFDLFPITNTENEIHIMHDYLFRGILMSWLSESAKKLRDKLHEQQKTVQEIRIREYSIFHRKIHLNSNVTQIDSNKDNITGVRYQLNIFDPDITSAVIGHLMNRELSEVQLGVQRCRINRITVETIDLVKFFEEARCLKEFRMVFMSPTAFSRKDSKLEIRFPIPGKIFGNLSRIWDNIIGSPMYKCSEGLYDWVEENVQLLEANIKMKSRTTGRAQRNFTGFTGSVRMGVDMKNDLFCRWLDILTGFGELSNTGRGRTSGFGHFKVADTVYFR